MSERVDQLLLEDVRSTLGKGCMLDMPAGDGDLSRMLCKAGFQVTPSDLFPDVVARVR